MNTAGWSRETGVLIIAYSLPVTLEYDEEKTQWRAEWTGDALIEAQPSFSRRILADLEYTFIGCPAMDVAVEDQEQVKRILRPLHCIPIFLTQDDRRAFFQGYCKSILWPTLHNVVNTDQQEWIQHSFEYRSKEEPDPVKGYWNAYARVNAQFAHVVDEAYQPGDVVWIHDYQLML